MIKNQVSGYTKFFLCFVLSLLTNHAYAQAIQAGKITKLFVSNDLSDKADAKRLIIR